MSLLRGFRDKLSDLCRESSLTISRDKVDLAGAVRSELCSADRQSKYYRPWFLVVKETME